MSDGDGGGEEPDLDAMAADLAEVEATLARLDDDTDADRPPDRPT